MIIIYRCIIMRTIIKKLNNEINKKHQNEINKLKEKVNELEEKKKKNYVKYH